MSGDPRATEDSYDDIAEIRREAADWIMRLDQAEPAERERVQAEYDAWQAVDPRRRRVLAQMHRMWDAVEPADKRRKAGLLGLVVLLGGLMAAQMPWAVWTADYRTVAGEIRDIELPDGSSIVLNTASAIDFEQNTNRRVVHLHRGEMLVTVGADRRPFAVETEHGEAVAAGTRYAVRRTPDDSIVTVHESSVRLVPGSAVAAEATLTAGQRARLTKDGVMPLKPAGRRLPDWTDRQLVFNDMPLVDVIDRLERYRSGWILLDDALAERDLRFTGVLPATDSDAALELVAESLSIDVDKSTPYLVRVRGRD